MRRTKIIGYIITIIILAITTLLFIPNAVWCQQAIGPIEVKQGGNRLAEESSERIILQVGKENISASDVKEYLDYRPISSDTSFTKEAFEQRLDEMITSEALYQEALKQNIQQDPTVRRIIHQILTQRLLEEKIEKKVWERTVGEEELQAYYDQHHDMFNRPQQVRLADIFIAVDENATSMQRAEIEKKAESILAEALKGGYGKFDFGELIKKYSDKHAKFPLGDTGYFDDQGGPLGLDIALAREALKLTRIGQVSDRLIETKEGYHIIMLVEKRPAIHKPLDEVKSLVERRIRREELERNREAYIKQVKESADIKRYDQAVTEIFQEIQKSYSDEHSPKTHSSPQGYKDRLAPPPFPGER